MPKCLRDHVDDATTRYDSAFRFADSEKAYITINSFQSFLSFPITKNNKNIRLAQQTSNELLPILHKSTSIYSITEPIIKCNFN